MIEVDSDSDSDHDAALAVIRRPLHLSMLLIAHVLKSAIDHTNCGMLQRSTVRPVRSVWLTHEWLYVYHPRWTQLDLPLSQNHPDAAVDELELIRKAPLVTMALWSYYP